MPKITLIYPAAPGRLSLRTELDWDRDLQAEPPSESQSPFHNFEVDLSGRRSLLFKPVLQTARGPLWSVGHNFRAREGVDRQIYPFFAEDSRGEVLPAQVEGRRISLYLPAGYTENTLKHYPVLYMNDGQNLFEPVAGRDWKVDETLDSFHLWSQIHKFIVVGLHHRGSHEQRERDYALHWQPFARTVVETIKPFVDARFRTLTGPSNTAIAGSSLGGLGALYLAWQYPEVFGSVACFSGAFPDYGGPFLELVERQAKPPIRVYLDSGMAGIQNDGFDSTREVRAYLLHKGFEQGRDLFYYCFPLDEHNETAWATRFSLPLQLFFGDT